MFLNVLTTWIRGLLSVAIVIAGVLLLKEWVEHLPRAESPAGVAEGASVLAGPEGVSGRPLRTFPERLDAWRRDPNRSMAPLIAGGLLLLFAVGGRIVSPRLWKRRGRTPDVRPDRTEVVETQNGNKLHVETFGPADAPPLVLIHGLDSDRTQWLDAVDDLAGTYRVIVYDLLGHGRSGRNPKADHSVEAMAVDLESILDDVVGAKAIVAGHSMGGMIALRWCALHPTKTRDRLAGLILIHTTPHNPFDTMAPTPLHRTLRKPLYVPLLRLTAAFSPLVRVMDRLSYWNGTTHWNNELQLFCGRETREQLDRTARVSSEVDPASQARFGLALSDFDPGLPKAIDVPTLVIGADRDPVTVPDASEEIASRIPEAELLMLSPARHMGFLECRAEFAEAVETLAQSAFARRRRAR